MVTGVVLPFPPPVIAFIFWAHRAQHPLIVDFSSSVANSRSRAFRKSISAKDEKLYQYALGRIRTHEADLYQARGYNLIPTGAVSDIEPVASVVYWGYTRILLLLILALVLGLNNHRRCEICWLHLFAEIKGKKMIN